MKAAKQYIVKCVRKKAIKTAYGTEHKKLKNKTGNGILFKREIN